MLIIPIAQRIDWRKPPIVTMILILINVMVHVLVAPNSDEAYQDAAESYRTNGLLTYEAELFRQHTSQSQLDAWGLAAVPEDDAFLTQYIVFDVSFDATVAQAIDEHKPHHQASAWRASRERFEQVRDGIVNLSYGMVPADMRAHTLLTSMFLHGDVGHLVGNMIFLFLFGFALERVLGSTKYLATYLLTGLAGGVLHWQLFVDSTIPTIGASGAVSGLMGAYLAVYNLRRIRFFYNVLTFFGEFTAPALIVLPLWVGKELYGFYFGSEGIAYWVHVGGLLSGMIIAYTLQQTNSIDDEDYLDATQVNSERDEFITRLDGFADKFAFDQARSTAAAWLHEHPEDYEMWPRYAALMDNQPAHANYPGYVTGLLKLLEASLPANITQELKPYWHSAFVTNRQINGPKPAALKDAGLLCLLARRLIADGHTADARHIVNALIKANVKGQSAGQVVKLLSEQLAEQGEVELANKYWKVFKARYSGQSAA